ncbi:MAG: glycosyltransferase [Anaerolineae bacterium]|nr:glycosyltransferase [Anaerolineae bacterium]
MSVIMPVYNSASYICDAINSLIAQNYSNLEIIVINDGSTDDTLSALHRYDNEIILIDQKNAGAAVARNRGLDCARGQYIAFLDSDDVWLPEKLRIQIAYLESHPTIGMVYSSWRCWYPDRDGQFNISRNDRQELADVSIVESKSGWLYDQLLFECILLTSTVVIRRSIVQQAGKFDTRLLRGQDYDYWIRVSRLTEIVKLNAELALYRIHGNSIAKNHSNQNYEWMVVEKAIKNWGLVGPNGKAVRKIDIKKRIAQLHFGFGYEHFWAGNPIIACESLLRSVRYRPLAIKHWLYIVLSLSFAFCYKLAITMKRIFV